MPSSSASSALSGAPFRTWKRWSTATYSVSDSSESLSLQEGATFLLASPPHNRFDVSLVLVTGAANIRLASAHRSMGYRWRSRYRSNFMPSQSGSDLRTVSIRLRSISRTSAWNRVARTLRESAGCVSCESSSCSTSSSSSSAMAARNPTSSSAPVVRVVSHLAKMSRVYLCMSRRRSRHFLNASSDSWSWLAEPPWE